MKIQLKCWDVWYTDIRYPLISFINIYFHVGYKKKETSKTQGCTLQQNDNIYIYAKQYTFINGHSNICETICIYLQIRIAYSNILYLNLKLQRKRKFQITYQNRSNRTANILLEVVDQPRLIRRCVWHGRRCCHQRRVFQ